VELPLAELARIRKQAFEAGQEQALALEYRRRLELQAARQQAPPAAVAAPPHHRAA
jgi:hypothetical protein